MEALRLRKIPGRNLRPAQKTMTAIIAKLRPDKRRCVPCTLQPIWRASHCTEAPCLSFTFSSSSSPAASRVSLTSSPAMLGCDWPACFLGSAASCWDAEAWDGDAEDCSCAYARAGTSAGAARAAVIRSALKIKLKKGSVAFDFAAGYPESLWPWARAKLHSPEEPEAPVS